jgi:hypothetical protein
LIVKKRFLSAWIAGALIACASLARAQSLGQYGGAETLPVNGHTFGTYVHASSHVVGFVSQLRLSFYPGVDFGFQGGLSRIDTPGSNRSVLRLGSDFKVALARASDVIPVDVAVGAALGVETGDNISTLTLGPMLVASRSFSAGAAGAFVPYGALGIAYSSIDVPGMNDTGLQIPVRLGFEMRLAPEMHFVLELQQRLGSSYSDRGALALGATLPF